MWRLQLRRAGGLQQRGLHVVAMARAWRPDMNDVDRLSQGALLLESIRRAACCTHRRAAASTPIKRCACHPPLATTPTAHKAGGAAKKRGTGSRNIPHRINTDERAVYDAAKKKAR
jgi:hypothetical protein